MRAVAPSARVASPRSSSDHLVALRNAKKTALTLRGGRRFPLCANLVKSAPGGVPQRAKACPAVLLSCMVYVELTLARFSINSDKRLFTLLGLGLRASS
ncbi:Uncharacterised protein [Mycobacteroides abscessus subsp. abscessus]|nr:Uncharacterised protein [Mycobacteroides abscessus subsp. abscessus]